MGKCETCLLELLDGTLVDTTALVDQVTGRGRLAGIDVADNDDVDVNLLLLTVMLSVNCSLDHRRLGLLHARLRADRKSTKPSRRASGRT